MRPAQHILDQERSDAAARCRHSQADCVNVGAGPLDYMPVYVCLAAGVPCRLLAGLACAAFTPWQGTEALR